MQTSKSLLERLRTNPDDQVSWMRLVKLYAPFLRKHVAAFCSPNDVDDVVQIVLLRVVNKISDFEHNSRTGAFRCWLRHIIHNCAQEHNKACPLPTNSETADRIKSLGKDNSELSRYFDHEHDQHVARRLIDLAREQFSTRDVDLFESVKLKELPVEEVAELYSVNPNIIYKAVYNITKWLRQESDGLLDA